MRLHRFYIDQPIGEDKQIVVNSKELVHQVRNVFRLSAGDSIIVFNGTGFDYLCKIDSANDRSTIVSNNLIINLIVTDIVRSRFVPEKKIYLCASLIKKDNFEWIVEKAVELGVTDIIPIEAIRSEKKSLNLERLNKIAIEASEQSGRGDIPQIHKIGGLKEVVDLLRNEGVRVLAFHTEGERFPAGRDIPKEKNNKNNSIGVFIGPEGGWTNEEIEMFHESGVQIVSLGPTILRAETAAIAALSLVALTE